MDKKQNNSFLCQLEKTTVVAEVVAKHFNSFSCKQVKYALKYQLWAELSYFKKL